MSGSHITATPHSDTTSADNTELPGYAQVRADDDREDQRQARHRLFQQYELATRSSEAPPDTADRRAEARRDFYRQYEVGLLRLEQA